MVGITYHHCFSLSSKLLRLWFWKAEGKWYSAWFKYTVLPGVQWVNKMFYSPHLRDHRISWHSRLCVILDNRHLDIGKYCDKRLTPGSGCLNDTTVCTWYICINNAYLLYYAISSQIVSLWISNPLSTWMCWSNLKCVTSKFILCCCHEHCWGPFY